MIPQKNQAGFTLTNILVSLSLIVVTVGGVKVWHYFRDAAVAQKTVETKAAQIKERFHSLIRLDGAWKNTMNAQENYLGMTCLRDHQTCFDRGGPFTLRDANNRFVFDSITPMNGLTLDGNLCSSYRDTGSEGCPFRVELSWHPVCEGTCIDPKQVKITVKISFRAGPGSELANVKIPDIEFSEIRPANPGVPRTCYDHLLAGKTNSGTYLVQPNPDVEAFPVFCDQVKDGGGWALVLSSQVNNSVKFPDTDALSPGATGRLPSAKIAAYLNASPFQSQNNIRFELPEVDGGIVLAASTNGAVDADAYVAPIPEGNCTAVPDKRNIATHSSAPHFSVSFSRPGFAEVSEHSDSKAGFFGFRICFGQDFLGQSCGQGCERKWTGTLLRQKGLVWIR